MQQKRGGVGSRAPRTDVACGVFPNSPHHLLNKQTMSKPTSCRRMRRFPSLLNRLAMVCMVGSLAGAGCSSSSSNGKCQAQDACHLPGVYLDDIGACTNPPAPDGTLCDDGTACTSSDGCINGYCVGTEVFCSQTDKCGYPAACDAAAGCPAAAATLACTTPPLLAPVRGCSASDYWTDVTIGGQTFSMIIDSGSTTLAVAGSDCARCGVSPEYSPGTTAIDANNTADAVYGDQSGWSGEIYQDSVSVAGAAVIPLDFAEIETQKSFFSQSSCTAVAASNSYQGILGLGPVDLAALGTEPYMYQFAAKTGYPNVFAVELMTSGGNLWIGGYDPTTVNGTMQFTPMVDSPYFSVAFSDFAVGGVSLGLHPDDFGPVVVDTGTSEFFLPDNIYTQIANVIQANATFQANFGTEFFNGGAGVAAANGATEAQLDAALPSITLSFPLTNGTSGQQISVTLPPTRSYLVPTPGPGGGTLYGCGIYAATQTLLGNSFMRALVVVFAADARQIGFALAKD